MSKKPIVQFIEKPMSGEWGVEPTNGHSIGVIRNANFTNEGVMDLSDIAYRDIPEKKIKQKALKHGDIIIEKSGGSPTQPVGRVVYYDRADGELMFSNFTAALRPRPGVDSRYLFFMLWATHLFKKTSAYQNKTTGIANLQLERYINEVELPDAPLPEQRRIAAILDKAQALVTNDKRILAVYDQLAKSLFLEMFGDPFSNPKGWPVKSVREVAAKEKHSIKAGPFGSALKKDSYVEQGYKIYGQEQVIRNDLSFGDYFIDEATYRKLGSCKVQAGDVLISLVGTYGKIAIVPDGHAPGIINPRLMKITLDRSIMLPQFFGWLLNSEGVKAQIANLSRGGTMDIVNVGIVSEVKIPVPPILLQEQFVRRAHAVLMQRERAEDCLRRSEALFGGLLQGAFSGGGKDEKAVA